MTSVRLATVANAGRLRQACCPQFVACRPVEWIDAPVEVVLADRSAFDTSRQPSQGVHVLSRVVTARALKPDMHEFRCACGMEYGRDTAFWLVVE